MKYVVLVIALLAAGCGSDSPIAPTPPAPASINATGNLTVTSCTAGSNGLFTCFGYSGTALNSGPGCAINVRGVTLALDAVTRGQTGSSGWSYSAMVRQGETIAYGGGPLVLQGPLSGGWVYTTTVSWDNTKCP